MMRRLVPVALTVVMALTGLFAQTATPPESITAEGSGQGIDRQEALLAAKRDAIEKGIGMVLLSQTEINNFMVQRDQVITKTMGAVKSFEIVSEGRTADNLIQVSIKAVLSRTTMREDLAAFQILIETMNKPRVMVIISETNLGTQEPTNQVADNAIIKFLRDPYEFDIIDPQVAANIKASQQKMATIAGGDASAIAVIGQQYGAEVMITGTAISSEAKGISQNLGGMVSVQADVMLKAINCSNGRVIGTGSAHGAHVHISPATAGNAAIEKAATKSIKGLLDAIIKEWQNQANNGVNITLTIDGVSTFRLKNGVLQTLQGMGSVSAVRERNWDDQSKQLVVDVQYKGTVNGLCSKIDGYKLKTGSGSLAVSSVNGANVTLKVEVM